jgi:hypothetical protein
MKRRIIAAAVVGALVTLLVPQSASAGKPGFTCPPGFDLGALTFEEGLQLPNIVAALADGVYDVPTLGAIFDGVDRNDDGLVCFKTPPSNANPASNLQYAYNITDDNASVPTR